MFFSVLIDQPSYVLLCCLSWAVNVYVWLCVCISLIISYSLLFVQFGVHITLTDATTPDRYCWSFFNMTAIYYSVYW